jgi:hypothetical protein
MTNRKLLCAAVLLAATTTQGWAKDAVEATVANWGGAPIVQNNGNPNAAGTYAVGTIQVIYTVVGYTFPTGHLDDFDLNWGIKANYSSGGATSYTRPITLNLEEIGGNNVELTPTPASFSVTSAADIGSSRVGVAIASEVATNPALNCDGCSVVGNLRLSTDPSGAKLDTVTNVQVKVVLMHPTACLKAYNFVTEDGSSIALTSTTLQVPTRGNNAGKVVSSNPGTFSDDVLIANTCANAESFDLKIGLDPNFVTNSTGNGVFTYSTAGEEDQSDFSLTSFGAGTKQGQQLCLQNVTVPAGTSFLATARTHIADNVSAANLPLDGYFRFAATLYDTVNGACTGALKPAVIPANPAAFALKFFK